MTDCISEPLAEIELFFSKPNYFEIYCLCSRAFIRKSFTENEHIWEGNILNFTEHDQETSSDNHYPKYFENQVVKYEQKFKESDLDIEAKSQFEHSNIKKNNFVINEKLFLSSQYYNSISYCLQKLEDNFFIQDNIENKLCPEKETKSFQIRKIANFLGKKSNSDKEKCIEKCEELIKDLQTNDHINTSFKELETLKHAMSLLDIPFEEKSNAIKGGRVTFRKKNIRKQNSKLKLLNSKPRLHLFFDEDGNSIESAKYTHNITNTLNCNEQNFSENECRVSNSKEDSDEFEMKLEVIENKITIKGSAENTFDVENKLEYIFDENEKILDLDLVNSKKGQKKKKKKKNNNNFPDEISSNKKLLKYWRRRYQLFSKFDGGIKLDAESWFSVTPEKLAAHHAERCRCDIVIDAFCGAGGNSIQFAFTCERVIAIDIDPNKVKLAKHNARIYGVEDRIEFIIGDFKQLAHNIWGDVVFLSPPWGGPEYRVLDVYDLGLILPPLGGVGLFNLASKITDHIAFFLPKNTNSVDIALLSGPEGAVEIEQNIVHRNLKSITAYFGELIMNIDDS